MSDAEQRQSQSTVLEALLQSFSAVKNTLQRLPNLGGDQRVTSDPLRKNTAFIYDAANNSASIKYGTVVEAIQHTQAYRVLPTSGSTPLYCTLMRHGSTSNTGVIDASTIPVLTRVLYIKLPFSSSGVILGTIPQDVPATYSDSISLGSNVGLITNAFEPFLGAISKIKAHGIKNWSSGTPIDSLNEGELNFRAQTGMMLHMDPYMSFMRVDDMAGLFLYYWDRLVRLCGINFERWTGGSILESLDDEGEHCWYEGWSTYPWEQRGVLWNPSETEIDGELAFALLRQGNVKHKTRINPKYDDQQPYHRLVSYKGYLGQGHKLQLSAPPKNSKILRYSDEKQLTGLFEETLTIHGHYGIRTAAGLTIAKRPAIAIPKRKALPADNAEGDARTKGYVPSGYSSGNPHKVESTLEPEEADAEKLSLLSAAGVLDLHAYLFNWESAHPFHFHENDFDYPEESELTEVDTNQEIPDWTELQSGGFIKAPDPKTIEVDHRNKEVKVYPNTSYITLTDDGGIAIGDGYGSELRMSGGNIQISAPGDILLEGGRNVMSWAGRDVILKARQSIDASASEKDVRIKAEQNIKMLAANDAGPHHILLECRAEGVGDHYGESGEPPEEYGNEIIGPGIILNTQKSEIIGLGNNVYMRATSVTGGASDVPNGVIALDAPSSEGVIRTFSNNFINTVNCGVLHFFTTPGSPSVNYFTSKYTSIGSACNYFNGSIIADANILARNNIFTQTISTVDCDFKCVTKNQINASVNPHKAWHTVPSGFLVTWYTQDLQQNWQQAWGGEGAAENKQRPSYTGAIPDCGFGFRDEEEAGTEDFILIENRWSAMARQGNSDGTTTWEENKVIRAIQSGTEDTWPFPGKESGGGDYWYYTYDTILHNMGDGVSKDRDDSGYKNAKFGMLNEADANAYRVISMPSESEA